MKSSSDKDMVITVMKQSFFDNENGFVGVAEYKNKEWSRLAEPLPEWMISFLEYIKGK